MRDALPTILLGCMALAVLVLAFLFTDLRLPRHDDYVDDSLIQRDGSLRLVESMTPPPVYPALDMVDEESGV